jgi:molecular chaperone Hsp33
MDRLVTALGWEGRARVLWVEATDVAREHVRRHGLEGRAARLGTELLVANVLMASWIKGGERLMLQLQTEGDGASFLGEVRADGGVRGRFTPAVLPGEGDALSGLLLAIKSDELKEMYRGVTEVHDEPIARALERHLQQSEQVLARVRIDVVGGDGVPERVQGLVVERLPRPGGGEAWDAAEFTAAVDALDTLDADALAEEIDAGLQLFGGLEVLEQRPLTWRCTCSRERVDAMLRSLGAAELQDMIATDHGAEITCRFCNEVYRLDEAELGTILADLSAEA